MVIIKSDINKLLLALLGRGDLVRNWWESPNVFFGGETPDEVYQKGSEGRKKVFDYVTKFAYH